MKQVGHGPTDLLFYFVGHGGFVGRNSEYYLAVRCTSSANPAVSGIRMEPLATTITDRARYLRRFIILDCCYAAAAFTAFQAEGPAQVAIRQTVDLFKEKAKWVGKGTALLCSSGKKVPSLLTAEEDSTLFSRALLDVLSIKGNPYRPDEPYLSLREVADLTEEVLGNMLDEQAPRPELHSPDQVDGDVAEVPFFPNPVVKAAKASPNSVIWSRQEEIARYATAPLPHPSPRQVSIPVVRGEPKRVGQVVSRRAVLVGLAGLAVAGGGLTWLVSSRTLLSPFSLAPTSTSRSIPSSPHLTPTTTPLLLGKLLYTYRGHSNAVNAVAWSPDGKLIASGSGDNTVQVWDATTGANVFTYRGHSSRVLAATWSPDSKRIASGDSHPNGTVQVWDATTGANVFTYQNNTTGDVYAVAWSPDGKRIASGGADQIVQVWDAADGGNIFIYRGHTNSLTGFVYTVAWSPNGKLIASGSGDNTVQVWDATTGANVFTYRGISSGVLSAAWSPDGKRIASRSQNTTVQVWDAADGRHVYFYRGHSLPVLAVAWSPDGNHIASGSYDQTVQVWDAADGGHAYIYRGHSQPVLAVAWSPDGKRIASGSEDKTVQVWLAE